MILRMGSSAGFPQACGKMAVREVSFVRPSCSRQQFLHCLRIAIMLVCGCPVRGVPPASEYNRSGNGSSNILLTCPSFGDDSFERLFTLRRWNNGCDRCRGSHLHIRRFERKTI